MSLWMPSEIGICRRGPGLSRNLFTSSGDDLAPGFVPNRNRVHGTGVARAQQSRALDRVGLHEDRDAAVVQDKRLGRFRDAVAEAHAQRAVDADPQIPYTALFEISHWFRRPETIVNRPTR